MSGHHSTPLLWSEPVVRPSNFGAPCIAVPNDPPKLGRYTMNYFGDFEFATDTLSRYSGGQPVW